MTDTLTDALIRESQRAKDIIIVCPVGYVLGIQNIVEAHNIAATVVTALPDNAEELAANGSKVLVIKEAIEPDEACNLMSLRESLDKLLNNAPDFMPLVDKQQRHRERQERKQQNKYRSRFYRHK